MRRLALLSALSCTLWARAGSAPAASVTAIRHWSFRDVTRIAVEVSGEFHYRSDRLHNPERIYFDILNGRNALGSRFYAENVSDQVVKRIRAAEANPGTTRVVIDLAVDVRATTTQLANPGRLIIELRSLSAPASATPTRLIVPEQELRRPESPKPPPTIRATQMTPVVAAQEPLKLAAVVALAQSSPLVVMKPAASVPAPAPVQLNPPVVAKAPPAQTIPPTVVKLAASAPAPAQTNPPVVTKAPPTQPVAPPVVKTAASAPAACNPQVVALAAYSPPASPLLARATDTISIPKEAAGLPDAAPVEVGKAARRTASGETSLIRALGLKLNRVVIDAGHGGHDQGTASAKGLLEKDLVLDIALRAGALIEDRLRAEVIYTRSTDVFVPLESRTALANEKKADLFISIHANASSVPSVSGVETYFLNFTEARDALAVAARENASSMESISELHDLIQKITLHDKAEESKDLAGSIQSSLFALYSRSFPVERDRGVRRAPFVVLIGATMPSVLAEIGFLSNPKEEALLRKPEYRQKVAEALVRGVEHYAAGLSHFQVAQNK